MDVVDHVGSDGLGPTDDPVLGADGGGGGLIGIGCAEEDGFVNPSEAEEESGFFAKVLIDAIDALVPVIVIRVDSGDVVGDAGDVSLREPL